jgi:hypothetical protein
LLQTALTSSCIISVLLPHALSVLLLLLLLLLLLKLLLPMLLLLLLLLLPALHPSHTNVPQSVDLQCVRASIV